MRRRYRVEPHPNVWRYRDYVIRAFNTDKPYDRFVRGEAPSKCAARVIVFIVGSSVP